jgi:hypothetical protein
MLMASKTTAVPAVRLGSLGSAVFATMEEGHLNELRKKVERVLILRPL